MALRAILEDLVRGKISIDDAEDKIRLLGLERVGEKLKLDAGREFRVNVPEIILAEYKDSDTLKEAVARMVEKTGRAIITRLRQDQLCVIREFEKECEVRFSSSGRVAVVKKRGYRPPKTGGRVGIVTAGTADVPVAEEVKIIVEEMGCEAFTVYDAGIAGLHRTAEALKFFRENDVDVIVAIAGMEGALPSVVKSLTDLPVIGLPTSKGYGMGGSGEAALLSMLQSCTPGLVVVNIDNSVGAAAAAAAIANRVARFRCRGRK